MKPSESFIAGAGRLFGAVSLAGLVAGCTTPLTGGQEHQKGAQSNAPGQVDSGPGDSSEIPPDERPF